MGDSKMGLLEPAPAFQEILASGGGRSVLEQHQVGRCRLQRFARLAARRTDRSSR